MKILIGSNNSSKQSEISSIFNESALEPITPQNLSINYDPPDCLLYTSDAADE